MQPISMPMDLGRVLMQRTSVRCQLVEELLMFSDVEWISGQLLKLVRERLVLTHQLIVHCTELGRKNVGKSLLHIFDRSSRGQAHKSAAVLSTDARWRFWNRVSEPRNHNPTSHGNHDSHGFLAVIQGF